MNEIEKAIKVLNKEKLFYKQEIKRLEDEEPMSAEEDYCRGHSEACCRCNDAIKAYDTAVAALQEKAGCESHTQSGNTPLTLEECKEDLIKWAYDCYLADSGDADPEGMKLEITAGLDEYIQEHARKPEPKESEQLCAENENFIQSKFGYCFYALDDTPFIYNLYVHPQYRRHGHSREILKLVINEIRKSGYEGEIFIEAIPKENSIGLADLTEYYKSMGLTLYDARKSEKDSDNG